MSDSVVRERAEQDIDQGETAAFNDLVAWAAERHAEGHCPAQVFNAMRDSGWAGDDAVAALLQALPSELHEQVRMLPRGAPDPDFSGRPSVVTVDGHPVQVLCDMRNPRLVVFGNLLSSDECNELIASASPRLVPSTVKFEKGHEPELNSVRTSWGMYFQRDETPLCTRLDARIAALLDWPVLHSEEIRMLRYLKGQQFRPHHDYFPPAEDAWSSVFRRGGRRVGTLLIYLSTPSLGGSTVFPDIPMHVCAVAGNAVFFAYETPDHSSRTLHGGTPVGDGEKWVAVKWFRQGPFE
jgi:prolyl 4-hydroxylase